MRKTNLMGNSKGMISTYWIILIFLCLDMALFSAMIVSRDNILSTTRRGFLEERILAENTMETTKYLTYKFVEDASIYAKDYTDYKIRTGRNTYTPEEIDHMYYTALDIYRNRKLTKARWDKTIRDTRERLLIQGYIEEYDIPKGKLKVDIVGENMVENEYVDYKLSYKYFSDDGQASFSPTPIYMRISYPSYDDMEDKSIKSPISIYTVTSYESSD